MFTEAEVGETFRFLRNKVNCFPGNQSLSDLLYSWKFWSWKVIKPHLNNGRRSTFLGFWYFTRSQSCEIQVNLWNPAKFTKTRKIARNSVAILSNTCLYNVFETYFSYRGYSSICGKLANLSWNFVTETCKQHPETTRRRLYFEKLGTSHHVKGFAIGSFLERIVVERANDDLC